MSIRTTIKGLALSTTVAAAVCVQAGAVAALPPTVTPPAGDYTLHIPSDQTPCGAFTFDVHDGERFTNFFDNAGNLRVVGINGQLSMHITSDVTGRSMDLHVSGPGKFFASGDGVLTGPMLLWGAHTLAFVHGRAFLPGLDVDAAQITGRRVDLCPLLT